MLIILARIFTRRLACAVEYAQDYAWEKIAKQIVEVYEGLAKKGGVDKFVGFFANLPL